MVGIIWSRAILKRDTVYIFTEHVILSADKVVDSARFIGMRSLPQSCERRISFGFCPELGTT